MLTFNKGTIYITGNACPITSDLSPRFQDWTFDMYQEDPYCRFLEPMLANPCPKGEIPHDGYIGEEKFDGPRAL
jgi:hypothetical protein